MAELVDALDSKSCDSNIVWVQVPLRPPNLQQFWWNMKEKELKKQGIKSLVMSISLFLLLFLLTFWLIFNDQDMGAILDVANDANILWIFAGLLLMVGYFLVQAWNVKSILGSLGQKISLLKMFKFTLIEFFFCAMTPSATGGQPLEIYYMSKEGISVPKATMAIFVQLCGYQIAVMTLGIISVLFLPVKLPPAVFMFFTIGLLINGVALLVLLSCVFLPKITQIVGNAFIKFAHKLHLKKADKMEEKLNDSLAQYAENATYIKRHKKEFLKAVGRVFAQVAVYYLVPFCVYKAFGFSEHNIFELFAMQSVLFIATAGFPIPGAVGLSESVFLSLYGTIFGLDIINSAMLLHRGITFYGFVIISMLIVLANIVFLKIHERSPEKKAEKE